METEHLFAREEVLPSWWANALGTFLGLGAFDFQLVKQDNTHIQVPASANAGAAVVAIQGRWRWIEGNVSRAHPGGGAGTYDIFVTAKETDIVSAPAPYTDDTDYSFALAIVAGGSTPAIVAGTVDVFRKVGSLQWDGAKITRIDQSVPATPLHAHRHATGQPDAIAPADIGAQPTPPLVTALPATPFDGQEIDFLADAGDGVVWRFRYRAASTSTFKWEFIGGSPLYADSNALNTITSILGNFDVLPNESVSLTLPTLPHGGDFDITIGSFLRLEGNGTNVTGELILSYGIGAVEADAHDGVHLFFEESAGSDPDSGATGSLTTRKLSIPGGVVVVAKATATGVTRMTPRVDGCRLSVLPVRVG